MTDADLAQLLRSTMHAFDATLRATLAGDEHAAGEVLRGSGARRGEQSAAREAVLARTWVPGPTKAEQLEYVADLGCVGELVDELARHVVAGGDPHALSPTNQLTVAVLLDAGGRRLRQLADSPVGPFLQPSHLGCGKTLLEVADHGTHGGSPTAALCAGLAAVLLRATRHASRAA
ncbi:hypothetical protein [Nocardioides dongkuii]|uniref:hypothetical protein n=1 Tax=Nocardioides dongkuii TaxID=2760089 RepID=UPI0015FC4558|nr:hypothetical protein [Nocardioides dongkuii]